MHRVAKDQPGARGPATAPPDGSPVGLRSSSPHPTPQRSSTVPEGSASRKGAGRPGPCLLGALQWGENQEARPRQHQAGLSLRTKATSCPLRSTPDSRWGHLPAGSWQPGKHRAAGPAGVCLPPRGFQGKCSSCPALRPHGLQALCHTLFCSLPGRMAGGAHLHRAGPLLLHFLLAQLGGQGTPGGQCRSEDACLMLWAEAGPGPKEGALPEHPHPQALCLGPRCPQPSTGHPHPSGCPGWAGAAQRAGLWRKEPVPSLAAHAEQGTLPRVWGRNGPLWGYLRLRSPDGDCPRHHLTPAGAQLGSPTQASEPHLERLRRGGAPARAHPCAGAQL